VIYYIRNADDALIGAIVADSVSYIERGIDFQPNLFNGYHAVEFGSENPPAVLNLPEGWIITPDPMPCRAARKSPERVSP